MQRRCRVQPRLPAVALRGVEQFELEPPLRQPVQRGPRRRELALAAQQHEHPASLLVLQFQRVGQLVQALAAEAGQRHQRGAAGWRAAIASGAPAAPQPRQLAERTDTVEAHRRVCAERLTPGLQRHARRIPARRIARCDDTGMGEAAFAGDAGVALVDTDLVTIGGQFVGAGDADDAGADDGNSHGASGPGRELALDAQRHVEHGVVAQCRRPHHQPDRQLVGLLAWQ